MSNSITGFFAKPGGVRLQFRILLAALILEIQHLTIQKSSNPYPTLVATLILSKFYKDLIKCNNYVTIEVYNFYV